MQDRGGSSWVMIARQHALTRVKLGFDIDEMVREFFILRRVLFEVLEERRSRFTLGQAELGELLGPIVKAASERAAPKGVQIDARYDPNTMLEVDLTLATSAVQNVVDNAAKFTDHGRVLVRVDDGPGEVTIHVFDECEGLSPEELATIFEPFKRGHSQKPGSGLGLAIARRAVEAHGKTIHAESTSAHGCHFWFGLPKASH
jgi:two-component system, OmpR family, sensor kinase